MRVPLPRRDILITDPPANLKSTFPRRKNIEVVICSVKRSEYNIKLHSACAVIIVNSKNARKEVSGFRDVLRLFASLRLTLTTLSSRVVAQVR